MQKLGMLLEGTRRQQIKKWDILEDLEVYGLLKAEWERPANKSLNTDRENAAG